LNHFQTQGYAFFKEFMEKGQTIIFNEIMRQKGESQKKI